MNEMLNNFINAIPCSIILIIIGYFLIGKQTFSKTACVKIIISILIYSLFTMINREIGDGVIRFMTAYLLMLFIYKYNFPATFNKLIIVSLISYVIMALSDILVMMLVLLYTFITKSDINLVMDVSNTMYINILVGTISIIILLVNKKILKKIVRNLERKINVSMIVIPLLLILTLSTLFFKVPTNEWKIDVDFYVNITLIIIMCIISVYILKQKSEVSTMKTKYQELISYSGVVEKLTEDYRIKQHENKNQLLIIKGMVPVKNKDLHQYIDNLLEKSNDAKSRWINNLKYIQLPEVKSFINYKIVEMEAKNISVEVNVNKSIQKLKYKNLSIKDKEIIYTLLGVYLDNALEAAEKSKQKEVLINIYDDKENIYFELYNTYKGKVNISKIDEYGYTNKGSKHGVGLYLVKSVLNNNLKYLTSRKLEDKYFIQIVTIKKNM